jgi:hypothetical protein
MMDAPEMELLLAAIDNELNNRMLSRIERVRLLDLWWRIATSDGPSDAGLRQAERELLGELLRRMVLAEVTSSRAAGQLSEPVGGGRQD